MDECTLNSQGLKHIRLTSNLKAKAREKTIGRREHDQEKEVRKIEREEKKKN